LQVSGFQGDVGTAPELFHPLRYETDEGSPNFALML
jgi:hypothetical protein